MSNIIFTDVKGMVIHTISSDNAPSKDDLVLLKGIKYKVLKVLYDYDTCEVVNIFVVLEYV